MPFFVLAEAPATHSGFLAAGLHIAKPRRVKLNDFAAGATCDRLAYHFLHLISSSVMGVNAKP